MEIFRQRIGTALSFHSWIVTSRHLYLLAFLILSAPLVVRLGYEVRQQDVEEKCLCCSSMRYLSEHHRCIWGVCGTKVLREEIIDSRVKTDFPELPCEHLWSLVSDESKYIAESWLYVGPSSLRSGWDTTHHPPAYYYGDEPRLREAVKAALARGAVSRQQMADWLADRDPQASSLAAKAEFDALSAAFR